MKRKFIILLTGLPFCLLFSCSNQETKKFDREASSADRIVIKAKAYTDAQYKNDEVPQHEYVKLTGKISKSDSADDKVEKNGRFILETTGGRYQIINDANVSFKKGDHVIVYGEYYGFIKAMRIDSELDKENRIK